MCSSHSQNLHVEVIGYSRQVANEISWVWTGAVPWLEKLAVLDQTHLVDYCMTSAIAIWSSVMMVYISKLR